MTEHDSFFQSFKSDISRFAIPSHFPFPYDYQPDALALLAAKELQEYIEHQRDWQHNFGFVEGRAGRVLGKMFGVLVVRNSQGELGYLCAFSGKLAGSNHHKMFVPPVYDTLHEDGFLNQWMLKLDEVNAEIRVLSEDAENNAAEISKLKVFRKENSIAVQEKIFDHYSFLNARGESKSLRQLFAHTKKSPPSGAGECAAPKLLHYAFQHDMQALSLAEFWWGLSPKSDHWKHKDFYPVCTEKCAPILKHMLQGMVVEHAPDTFTP